MPAETLAAVAAATTLGACLQSAGGFGFALVAGPALFAALSPHEAIGALLLLGAGLNLLMLVGEGRRADVRWPDVAPMLAAAAPGIAAGALVLDALPKPTLQVLVGVGVLAAAAVQHAVRSRAARPAPAAAAAAYPVGILAGALTTSTGVNGPPLLLWLRARGALPGELRDSLAASFLALNAVGVIVVGALGGPGRAFDAGTLALLTPATVLGHAAGRRLFARLPPHRFDALGIALVLAAGSASVVAGLASQNAGAASRPPETGLASVLGLPAADLEPVALRDPSRADAVRPDLAADLVRGVAVLSRQRAAEPSQQGGIPFDVRDVTGDGPAVAGRGLELPQPLGRVLDDICQAAEVRGLAAERTTGSLP